MKKSKGHSIKRIVLLFLVYTFLFVTVFFFIDFYDFYIINPYFLILMSVILGAIAAYIHNRNAKRSKVDDLIDKL